MKKTLLLIAGVLVASSLQSEVGIISYTGVTNTLDNTGPDWVSGTDMYRFITDGQATPTGSSGLTTFDTYNINGLRITFDDLDLVVGESLSPGAGTPGYEVYRDLDGTSNLQFRYDDGSGDDELWVSGRMLKYTVDVINSTPPNATGLGVVIIENFNGAEAGAIEFYNEIMDKTGGTGIFTFTADSFSPVSYGFTGTFNSVGSIIIPEPSTYAGMGGLFVFALLVIRRTRREAK